MDDDDLKLARLDAFLASDDLDAIPSAEHDEVHAEIAEMKEIVTGIWQATASERLNKLAHEAARDRLIARGQTIDRAAVLARLGELSGNDNDFRLTLAARGGPGATENDLDAVLDDIAQILADAEDEHNRNRDRET